MTFDYSDYSAFEKWMDDEMDRLDRLSDLFDIELTQNVRRPLKSHYEKIFAGAVQIVELLCGKIYVLNELGKPLGLIKAHPEICFGLKETDKLVVKLGFADSYWYFLRLDSIEYASPDEDLANQKKKRVEFIQAHPWLSEMLESRDGEPAKKIH